MLKLRGALFVCLTCAAGCATPSLEPQARTETAREAFLEGDAKRAAREAKLALQHDPLDSDAHFLLACLLAQEGHVDQAIVGFRRAWKVDPTHHAAAYNQGTMLLRREEPIPAARLLEAALASRPDHVPTYNNLGKAYFLAGLPELAVASYEEALRRDPTNAVALGNLEAIHEGAGLHEAAESYRRRRAGLGADAADALIDDRQDAPPEEGGDGQGAPKEQPADGASRALRRGPQSDALSDVVALHELLSDLPHVQVDQLAGRPTLTGWTRGPSERGLLDRVLQEHTEVRDLTTSDIGDPQRMIEVDATIFVVITTEADTTGFNFLRLVNFSFDFFQSDHDRDGTGFSAPGTIGNVDSSSQSGWLLSASVDYDVTIANAVDERVSVLARPHLTTLSGTPATFLAGGRSSSGCPGTSAETSSRTRSVRRSTSRRPCSGRPGRMAGHAST